MVCPGITQVIFQVTETNLQGGVLVEMLSEEDRCLSVVCVLMSVYVQDEFEIGFQTVTPGFTS